MPATTQDGIHAMVPRDKMTPSAVKLRDTYSCVPGAPFYHKTFGLWMCEEAWYEQGLERGTNLNELFLFDEPGYHELGQLGWCETAFMPLFEEKVLEDRGEHELAQDAAGRAVLYSGLTVATSLSALLVFAEPVLRSLAYGGMAATLLAVATVHWLLPPLLRRHARVDRVIDRIDVSPAR